MAHKQDMITELLEQTNIFLTRDEVANLEVTDFGLGDFDHVGLTIHTYINTARCCAKEIFMLPHQLCPEHQHPTIGTVEGKEENFRCRFGRVSLFIDGDRTAQPSVTLPEDQGNFTVFKEVVLNPGDQLTLKPNTKHWFKAHGDGAVISEFSTHSDDDTDIFTDLRINRASRI